jgi:hypothetical protein
MLGYHTLQAGIQGPPKRWQDRQKNPDGTQGGQKDHVSQKCQKKPDGFLHEIVLVYMEPIHFTQKDSYRNPVSLKIIACILNAFGIRNR